MLYVWPKNYLFLAFLASWTGAFGASCKFLPLFYYFICAGGLFCGEELPSMINPQLSDPLELKLIPIGYPSRTNFYKLFRDICKNLYHSLLSKFFFLWNFIALKSPDSMAPFIRNYGVDWINQKFTTKTQNGTDNNYLMALLWSIYYAFFLYT